MLLRLQLSPSWQYRWHSVPLEEAVYGVFQSCALFRFRLQGSNSGDGEWVWVFDGRTRYIHKVLSADVMVSGYVVWFAYFCISIELNPSKTLLYLRLRLWKRNESNANHITAWSLGTRSILWIAVAQTPAAMCHDPCTHKSPTNVTRNANRLFNT